ncbi:MAG: hypothetical protein E7265_01260 [Lachnospiraceae bacterium]|nr:hypothetical protein [Lachnospiraceae bacterium]
MKNKILFLVFVSCLVLISCNNDKINTPANNNSKEKIDKQIDNSDNSILDENGTKTLSIYTLDHGKGCIPSISLIDKDQIIDAKLIVNEVIANYDEKVNIYDIEENEDNVVVIFEDNSAPMVNVAPQTEEAMLDCIAYSLIDNLDYCNEIYFRCKNGKYKSKNITFNVDEPYITR